MDDKTSTPGAAGAPSAEDDQGRFGRAKEFVSEKASAAKEQYTRAAGAAKEQYTKAQDAAKEQYNRVREKVEDVDFGEVAEQVRGFVRSNPGKALLIAVGAGFLFGLLLRRDDDDE